MDTQGYLMQIRRLESRIKRKELRCEELRTCLDAKAIRYDVDRVQTSPVDKVSRILSTVKDLEDEIKRLRIEKAELVIEISDTIELLDNDNEKTVLTEFYIGRVPMTKVAESIHYSVRRAYYFRKQGLLHLGEIIDGSEP